MGRKLRVVVAFGGRSGEHEVSLRSAQSIMNALDHDKYEIIALGITKTGEWLLNGDPLKQLAEAARAEAGASAAGAAAAAPSVAVAAARRPGLTPIIHQQRPHMPEFDVVFPVLHGPYGEDGTMQGLLDMAGVAYVGAGVMASAVGMDKAVQKALFRQYGLPVVKDVIVKRRDWEADAQRTVQTIEAALRYPVFVKPANLGSSVGISRAVDRAGLVGALTEAAQFDRKLLVEEAVPHAREIECGVLGNDDPITSVCGEIVPKREFYDYVAKYADDSTELIVPADLPAPVASAIRDMSRRAFLAIDCAGMARVDFLATQDLSRVYLSEVNTIPGFTSVSMYPRLFQASGMSYSELLDRLIVLALERHADKGRTRTSWT